MEEKVREWQESGSAAKNVWFTLIPNWVDCVLQALKFLAGDLIGENQIDTWLISLLSAMSWLFIALYTVKLHPFVTIVYLRTLL